METDWSNEIYDWNFCKKDFNKLNRSFDLFGFNFYSPGFFDKQDYIILDFYTQQNSKEMTIFSAASSMINGENCEIKKCISFKPSLKIKCPMDLKMLCKEYNINIEDIGLFERVEIFKKNRDFVFDMKLLFHESGDFQKVIIL